MFWSVQIIETMAQPSMPPVGLRASADASRDRRQSRPARPPRSLLAPPRADDDEDFVLETAPAVYPSEVQMYVAIDRMVVTLFRSFDLTPEL